jgi:hypothetical protein
MKSNKRPSLTLAAAALALACGTMGTAHAAAQIVINNLNAPGVGFNDPTPVAPVGGNTGTTLGQQRLIAFTHAANIWGAILNSNTPIVINAQFRPLSCTATSATLGSAGATQVFASFTGAPKTGVWYSYALANKLFGKEISSNPGAQINANFNSELGKPNCLAGSSFYLGLDANEGNNIDFVATLLHEMGHGLGFQTFTNGQTGANFAGYPSVWDHYLLDNTTGKLWIDMTNAERAASSLKPGGLSWTGPRVTAAAPSVLTATAQLRVVGVGASSPDGDLYAVGEADFGPKLDKSPLTGQIAAVALQPDSPGSACTPFNAANAEAVRRKIALVSRGTCGFTIKVKNAQDAGAIGVIVADNAPGAVTGLGGSDPSITIPALRVSQADGAKILASLTKPNGNANGTVAKFERSKTLLSGTDSLQRVTMFSPNPYQPGSSISHFNTTTSRNQLMEPSINSDLTHSVTAPTDLTLELFKDIGW